MFIKSKFFLLQCLALTSVLLLPFSLLGQDHTDEQLAAQYFREGRFERAAALYEELFEKNPTRLVYNNYLESLFAIEEFRKAERVVRSLIRENPGEIRYQVDLGWVHHEAGNERQARRQLDGLISDMQANPDAVNALAGAFESRGFFERALETYKRGRRLLGQRHPFHIQIARLYERKEDYVAMMNEYIDYLVENISEMERVRGLLQDAITNDPDFSRNEALREVLMRRTQRNPDNTLYSEMLLWLSLQQKDFNMAFMQARALDRRLRKDGEMVLEVATLSTNNENYNVAAKAFQFVLDKGEANPFYIEALVGYLDVKFLDVTSSYTYEREDLLRIEKEYQEAIEKLGVHRNTVRLIRNLANLQAFYLGKTGTAIELLHSILDIPNVSNRVKAECRIELADILVLIGDVWDAKLLYAQVDRMFRDDPLAHEAKFKNARLSFYIGEFDWAKAQLDILKAGTSRLIANDAMKLSLRIQDNIGFDENTEPLEMYARAEKLIFMNRLDEAIAVLDSVNKLFPGHQINDDVIYARVEIMMQKGDYQQADSLLAKIVEQYPSGLLADDALFKRAELYENIFEDREKAMNLYQELMVGFPGSLHTVTARNRFRTLRGDLVN